MGNYLTLLLRMFGKSQNNSVLGKKVVLIGHSDGLGGAQTAFRELKRFLISEGYFVKIIVIGEVKEGKKLVQKKISLATIPLTADSTKSKASKGINLIIAGIRARFFYPDFFISVGLSNSANFILRYLPKDCFTIAQDFIANRCLNDVMWTKSRSVFQGFAVQAPSMLNYWRSVEGYDGSLTWLPCFPEPPINTITHTVRNIGDSTIKLAFFGRLAANKGIPLFFKALAANLSLFNITLDLWGEGAELENLRLLSEQLNITNSVRFLYGYPAGYEGGKLMVSYDALILTSTEMEGLPLILLESMAYGLPFLTTNIGAISDCCYQNEDVVLVEPTEKAIQQGLCTLCFRLQAGDFNSQRLQNYYQTHFSHSVMANRWRRCLQDPHQFFLG